MGIGAGLEPADATLSAAVRIDLFKLKFRHLGAMAMNRKTFILAMLCACVASACATAPKSKEVPNEASSITYQLPVTAAQVTLEALITDCKSTPMAKGAVTITPVVQPTPYAEHRFTIAGSDLSSFTKKKEIKIDLYPNGSIKSINSTVADRTGAIIANVLKLAATVLFADSEGGLTAARCNDATKRAWNAFGALKLNVDGLKKKLEDDNADHEALQKKIDVLAAEMGRLLSDQLTIKLTRSITFAEGSGGGKIAWKAGELKKWLEYQDSDAALFRDSFQIGWCVGRVGDLDPLCSADLAVDSKPTKQEAPAPGAGGQQAQVQKPTPSKAPAAQIDCMEDGTQCRTTLVFREPVQAVITVVALGTDLGIAPDATLAQLSFPMAQWGKISYLPLTVGFGGSKSVSMTLDEFGTRNSFSWSSGARGEEITGGAQTVADAATAFKTARDGEDLRSEKAQIEALEAQQKLNKLRKCQAILDAGGFVCPEE